MLSARTNLYSYIWTFILVLMTLRYNPSAYNIDSRNVQIFSNPVAPSLWRGSYFGFSVALHTGWGDPVVLVGAPRANSSALRNVMEPGTVFKCTMNDVCKEWVVDRSENDLFPRDKLINQVKDNAWIGANIAADNKTAKVVVCGPMWKVNTYNVYGICYGTVAVNASAFESEAKQYWSLFNGPKQKEFVSQNSYFNYGYAQVGFSLHMNSRNLGVDIVLGSPGVYLWKGDTILITDASHNLISRTIIPTVTEEQSWGYYDYFGYSITSGDYFKQGEMLYASSATRSTQLRGKVIVFNFPPKSLSFIRRANSDRIIGEQVGEYFGAALTSCDINNDGRDELIVGSPYWARDVDEGRVYIFTARQTEKFELLTKIEGEIAGGRFGSTLMCLGDIDYDGHGDIAVGAPYEEKSGGAVYIYNGNAKGVFKSQRLIGSDYSPLMRGFGISISEPRDVNDDNYLDIAVGAYLSEKVVLLRSMPVVTLNVTLTYLHKIKVLRNTSFTINIQVYYGGTYVPNSLRIVKVLKIDQTHSRVTYHGRTSDDGIYRISDTLYKNNTSCSLHQIYLIDEIQNVLDPLEVFVSIEIENDFARSQNSSNHTSCTSCVVTNKFLSKTEDLVKLPFALDCGEDEICMSDLKVTLSTDLKLNNRYVIGSSSPITLYIDTRNQGEPAYQAKVHIFIETLSLASISPECMENSNINHTLHVICVVGNPLRTNKTLMLQLDASMVTYDTEMSVIRANLTSHSNESMPRDNSYVTTVYFDMDMDIAIVGKAQVSSYSYLHETEKMLDKVWFQHFYEIQRFGVSPIKEVTLTMKIPTHWRHSTGDIVIANIDTITSVLNESQFHCSSWNDINVPLIKNSKIESAALVDLSYIASNSTYANSSSGENAVIDVPPVNRTLYINCTNDAVRCEQISCKVGPFPSTSSVARLLITLDLQVQNFYATLMKNKDIVFYVSESVVTITQPYNIIQRGDHKPDVAFIATTFLGSPVAERIAMWILILSTTLGIILLLLLILGLIKVGFFNRNKKMELEALKAKSDIKYDVVLEMTSSIEALHCN